MSLDKFTRDEFTGYLQVLQRRLQELEKEQKLPPKQRRLDREIEFNRRTVVQSGNAIYKYKDQAEVKVASIRNNLVGLDAPELLTQYLKEIESQGKQDQTKPDKQPEPVTQTSVKTPEPIIETPEIVREEPSPVAPQQKPLSQTPVKVPEPIVEASILTTPNEASEPSREKTDQVTPEKQLELPDPEAPMSVPGPVVEIPVQFASELPAVSSLEIKSEPVREGEEPSPVGLSVISRAPFTTPIAIPDLPDEEEVAASSEPGVQWNGKPRAGNIFKVQNAYYGLEKCLESGRYCETWIAVAINHTNDGLNSSQVVLKVANPGLTAEEMQRFEAEIDLLEQLGKQPPEDLLRINGKLLIPEIIEVIKNPAVPPGRTYFTQTLATGQPIEKLRRERGRLVEYESVEIAAQLCRVLQALHEGPQVGLIGALEENVYWDERSRRISFTGMDNVSMPGQAKPIGDVIAVASELYQLLMGIPAPIPGSSRSLIEPIERWNELSLGIQEILVQAFDPLHPYQAASELREELEYLAEFWKQPWWDSMAALKDLFNSLPQDGQFLTGEQQKIFIHSKWAASILDKIADRPENNQEVWVLEFRKLNNQLIEWQTGAYWIEKGKRSYQSLSWDLAEQDFSQALKDTQCVVDAARWLQAVKAARAATTTQAAGGELDIAKVMEAMDQLGLRKYSEAALVFETLATGEAQKEFGVLAAEVRLQETLQRIPGLLEKSQYKELAEAYQNAIEWVRKLPRRYKEVVLPGSEEFESKQREYASRNQKVQKIQERYAQLKSARNAEFPEFYTRLRELLDQQPGDVELLKVGNEDIYRLLSQGKYAEGRALAALCLDYNCGTDPYIHQVWQYACQLERFWQAWSGGNGPAFRNTLLNQAWPADLWAELVRKILERSLELPDEYFIAEFLEAILVSSKISLDDPKIREQIEVQRAGLLEKIDAVFVAEEEDGTDLLVKLIGEHPYSMTLFNLAAEKVELMLQKNNFSAALKIAQAVSTQFSIRDLQADKEKIGQSLELLRSFLASATRILPLQKAWLNKKAVGLAQQLDLESPWGEGTHWDENELVFLRDFLNSCFKQLEKKDYLGWNLVLSKVDPEELLYQRLKDRQAELDQGFEEDIQKRLEEDAQLGLEFLRSLWMKYPLDPILERVSLKVIDNDFLFKDEHAEKASKLFGKLSGCPQPLKERIGLSAKYAQYYRLPPDDPERTSRELLDKLLEFGKHQQLLLERASFLEAVYLRWFNWALDDQNLAILQNVYALLPKEKWCKAEVDALSTLRRMYTEKVQNLADLTSEALKKGEQIEQHPVGLAAKLIKNLQKQPSIEDALLEWDGLIDDLRTWIVKTRRAGWSEEAFRLESYLEKLTKQYGRVELLIKRKMSETNLVLIGELWKLALPGTPEDPEGEPKQTPKASDANRLQWLMQMEKACLDLLKTYPKDSQTKAWLSWQSRIQTEIRKIQKP